MSVANRAALLLLLFPASDHSFGLLVSVYGLMMVSYELGVLLFELHLRL